MPVGEGEPCPACGRGALRVYDVEGKPPGTFPGNYDCSACDAVFQLRSETLAARERAALPSALPSRTYLYTRASKTGLGEVFSAGEVDAMDEERPRLLACDPLAGEIDPATIRPHHDDLIWCVAFDTLEEAEEALRFARMRRGDS